MLTIQTIGEPYERGVQQGQQCRAMVQRWMPLKAMADQPRVMPRQAEFLADILPDTYRQCLGIAEGLSIAPEPYFHFVFGNSIDHAVPKCSVFGARDGVEGIVIAKTDDVLEAERGLNVLEYETPHQGLASVHFHFMATPWTTSGMNQAGLAIAMTGIPGRITGEQGVASLFALHSVLPRCATVAESIAWLESIPINTYGFSLLIGDAQGALELIECNADGLRRLPAQVGRWHCHTNHILDQSLAARSPAQAEPINTNGRRRMENLLAYLKDEQSQSSLLQSARHCLTDRNLMAPACQCGEDGLFTDYAVIFQPQQLQMIYWPGNPAAVKSQKLCASEMFTVG